MDERGQAMNFFKSSLATDDWPGDAYHRYALTQRAFWIFFSLPYGARLTLDQILGCPVSKYDDHGINGEAFTIALLVCAYAELNRCLEWIGPRIMAILQSSPKFWEAVADMSREHLMLAEKLEQGGVWNDAFRHLIGRASMTGDWKDIEEITPYTSVELRKLFDPQSEELNAISRRDLSRALQKLQHDIGRWHDASTCVRDPYSFHGKLDGVEHMAGMIFGEWMVYQSSEESVRDCWPGLRGEAIG
jgi:hypothetical protein